MCRCLTKYTLFTVNLIFVVIGLALIGLGVAAVYKLQDLLESTAEQVEVDINLDDLNYVPYPLIALGVIIFLIAFFGCCGAVTDSKCLLITYAVIISVLAAIKIAATVTIFVELPVMKTGVQDAVNDAFVEPSQNVTFHALEAVLQCCGTTGPDSYDNEYNLTAPTCCPNPTETTLCKKEDAYKTGCTDFIADVVEKIMQYIGFALIAIIVFELVATSFSVYLIKTSLSSLSRPQASWSQAFPYPISSFINPNPANICNRNITIVNTVGTDTKREEIKIPAIVQSEY